MIPQQFKIKNTVKYPTSLVFGGLSKLGLEIIDSLLEQGGYVIVVDTYSESNLGKLKIFPKESLVSFIDYTTLPHLDEELRRLDYIFFFNHESLDLNKKIPVQDFLKISNYIDTTLALSAKFEAKFLLTTAIKANQLTLYNEEITLLNHQTHKTYTNADIQRHSETMVLEYIEKNALDARIVRMGEVIGDGIDFSIQTAFNDLIIRAARGESLKLSKDGLETEWLVHILDAAYGVIKAQFSKNTVGKIFSLSYENSLSHLALAYKLQEIEPTAQEIEFIEAKDNLPSLKLYKPAPNLSVIGWASKVSIEKALKQSVASAKIYLLESQNTPDKKGNISSKLKTFFALADSKDSKPKYFDLENEGPISRLIAERRRQELEKQKGMELANGVSKNKKKKRNKTLNESFNNFIWNIFLEIGKNFSIFKNKSPLEISLILLSFAGIAFIFFAFISPILVFARNLLIVLPEYSKIVETIEKSKWLDQSLNYKDLSTRLNENKEIIENFSPLFSFLALNEEASEVRKVISNYSQILDGIGDIDYAMDPLKTYLNNYQGNLQLRTSTESYLSVTNSGIDYENILLDFDDRKPYLQTGVQKYINALTNIRNTNFSLIPSFMQQNVSDLNSRVLSFEEDLNSIISMEHLEDLLGVYTPKTYLLLLQDNTRLKSIGGEISAFSLITVKNGSIIEVIVKSPDDTLFKFDSVTDQRLKEINASKFTYVTKENLSLNDLSSMPNFAKYSEYISDIFSDTFTREISGVMSFNYSTLESFLREFNTQDLNISGVNFSTGDFLKNLSATQDINSTLELKHKVSAQLLANLMNTLLNNPTKYISQLTEQLNFEIESKNLLISTSELSYDGVVLLNNYDSENIVNVDSYVKVGYNLDDIKIVNIEKYPELTIAKEVSINPEYNLVNKLTVGYPLLGSSQEILVCLPFIIPNSAIRVTNIPSERYVINSSESEKCIVVKAITEREFQVYWDLSTGVSNTLKEISLGVAKIKGTRSTIDYKVTLDGLLKLITSEPFVVSQNRDLIFTTNLSKDLIINLELER